MSSAKARYDDLVPLREPYLRRARACSKFTVPTLIPPEGWTGTSDLPEPWNNLGARGVHHLSSKVVNALFPPGAAFFRNEIDPRTVNKITEQYMDQASGEVDQKAVGQVLSLFDSAMAEVEKRSVSYLESSQVRPSIGESAQHLIVGGNILLHFPEKGGVRAFRLDRFVVSRDPSDNLLEIVVHEQIARAAAPPVVQAILDDPARVTPEVASGHEKSPAVNPEDRKAVEKTVDLYTHVYRDGRLFRVYQEVCGKEVPGSRGSYPLEKLPWLPLRWTKVTGEDYGWSHVHTFLGDLKTLDMLSQAVTEGAAAAARVVFAKKPGSVGKVDDLVKAPNGGVVVTDHDAYRAIQVEKFYDFRTAHERINELEKTLSYCFLMNTAIQRNGERVTAEEIRFMADELNSGLGGVYSMLSQELQLPFARITLASMERQKLIPKLPPDVKPIIVTGLEALGRGNDLSRLTAFIKLLAETLGPEVVAQYLNSDEFMRRCAVALSIDTKNLIRSADEIAQGKEQAQLQQLMQQFGPNAINQLGALAKANVDGQNKVEVANVAAQAKLDASAQPQQRQAA